MNKTASILLWIFKIIISLLFVFASLGKLTNNELVIEMFRDWGYFDGFYFVIGILEFILAILLLIPKTSFYSTILLSLLMIGAMLTHLFNDPIIEIVRPLVFMIPLTIIIYFQWRKKMASSEE